MGQTWVLSSGPRMQNPNHWMAREVLFPSDYKNGIDSQKREREGEKEKRKSGRKWSEPVPTLSTMDKALTGQSVHIQSYLCCVLPAPSPNRVIFSPLVSTVTLGCKSVPVSSL